jgi:hypothetical protein
MNTDRVLVVLLSLLMVQDMVMNDGTDESWGPKLDIGLMIPQWNSPVDNNGVPRLPLGFLILTMLRTSLS